MANTKSITAVLVAHNHADSILKVIAALIAAPEIARIIVVDNCSVDSTIELIERDFPSVEMIENPRNIGFGPAANSALGKVQTPYALVAEPSDPFVFSLHSDAAISGHHRHMLLSMEHLRPIGFFDPRIFMFYEYDDLCLRAEKAGHKVVKLPPPPDNSPLDYFHEQHRLWSQLYLLQKHQGIKKARQKALMLELIYSAMAAFHTLRFDRQKTDLYRGRLKGIFDFKESRAPQRVG